MKDFNNTQLEYLEKFNNGLSEGVSKDDILSLENFVGKPVITAKYNINKFTNNRGNVLANEVSDEIETILNETPLENSNGYHELLTLMLSSRVNCLSLLRYLEDFMSVDRELIDLFMNEKFIHSYSDNDELFNITTDENIFTALFFRRDYISKVISEHHNVSDTVIKRYISNLKNRGESLGDQDEYLILGLLNAVFKNQIHTITSYDTTDIVLDKLTIKDMYDFWHTNVTKCVESIKTLIGNIEYDLDATKDCPENYYITNRDEFKTLFKKYRNISNLLNDKSSFLVLKAMGELKTIKGENS